MKSHLCVRAVCLAVLIVLLTVPCCLSPVASAQEVWTRIVGGEGGFVRTDSSGNVYVVTNGQVSGFQHIRSVKYDTNGNLLWSHFFTSTRGEVAGAIAVDTQGNLCITGYSFSYGSSVDYLTIKYDTNGVKLWHKRYSTGGNRGSYAKDIVTDGQGNIYVTGTSESKIHGSDYLTIKYSPIGVQLWVKRFYGPGTAVDGAAALALDGARNVYVTGLTNNSSFDTQYATVKYDTNGNQLWYKRYNSPGNNEDFATAIGVSEDGFVYVTGASDGGIGAGFHCTTLIYSTDGLFLWKGTVPGIPRAVVVNPDSRVYVAGSSRSGYFAFELAYEGPIVWQGTYGSDTTDNQVSAIALDKDGNLIITGTSYDNRTRKGQYLTVKYDNAGNLIWVRRYAPRTTNSATSLAVDSAGNIYVTGIVQGQGTNTATIKYAP